MTQYDPRLKHRARHYTDILEYGTGNKMNEQRVVRDNDIFVRHDRTRIELPELEKEILQCLAIPIGQNLEAGQGRSSIPIAGRWNPPNSTMSFAQLRLLLLCVFDEPIWWVRDHGMN